MIPLLTAAEMQALEAEAIGQWGVPSLVLQEHAALGALALLPAGEPLTVLAGPGNNGGDALALARLALLQGRTVTVWALPDAPEWKGDGAVQASLWWGLGQEIRRAADPQAVVQGARGWVVDGLFGLGTRLPLRDTCVAWVEALARGRAEGAFRVLALDLPTGLDPSSSEVSGPVLAADVTAAFGHLKRAHGLLPARALCGRIEVVPIPLHRAPVAALVQAEGPGPLHGEAWNTHKRTFGHVAIRAGRKGMSGAAVLAALGALRAGAGLVTVLADEDMRREIASQVPEAMVDIYAGRVPEGIDALLVGPGGITDIPDWEGPLVLDASALKAGEGPRWMARPDTVLTPHPGEFARLFPSTGRLESTRGRLEAAARLEGPAVLLLKGAQSLVAGATGPVQVVTTGHPGLSTGGSGDFLAGMIAARVAGWAARRRTAGAYPAEVALGDLKQVVADAAWLHGAAADRLGRGPLLVRELGDALASLLREREQGHA